jgi:Tol biopolymer transport system component
VFVKQDGGDLGIFAQRTGGANAVNLTADSPRDDSEPAVSPHGSQIAFRSERDGGGLFVMGATGESVRRLTDPGYNPGWSPAAASSSTAPASCSTSGPTRAPRSARCGW